MAELAGGSVSTMGGGGSDETFKHNPGQRKKTPKKYKIKKDARSEQKGGTYPNYMSYKSRSGHSLIFDDSEGNETVTLQHRSGTAVQMRPDGGLLMTTHNGKYEVVFGEDRLTISGAQDITVKGDTSLRCYGDYNVTCHKDYNLTVMGDFNITAKNHNRLIRGNIDTIAKNETKKMEGSSSGVYGGGYARASEGASSVVSRKSSGYFGGGAGAHFHKVIEDEEGPMTVFNGKGDTTYENKNGVRSDNTTKDDKKVYAVTDSGKYSVKADDRVNVKTDKEMQVESQDDMEIKSSKGMKVSSSSGGMKFETQGEYSLTGQASGKFQFQQDMQHQASGSASYSGSTTHVGGSGETVVSGSTTHVDGQSALNLNGGGAPSFSGTFGSMNFNIGSLLSQIQMPGIDSDGADASKTEPDSDSWTDRLA